MAIQEIQNLEDFSPSETVIPNPVVEPQLIALSKNSPQFKVLLGIQQGLANYGKASANLNKVIEGVQKGNELIEAIKSLFGAGADAGQFFSEQNGGYLYEMGTDNVVEIAQKLAEATIASNTHMAQVDIYNDNSYSWQDRSKANEKMKSTVLAIRKPYERILQIANNWLKRTSLTPGIRTRDRIQTLANLMTEEIAEINVNHRIKFERARIPFINFKSIGVIKDINDQAKTKDSISVASAEVTAKDALTLDESDTFKVQTKLTEGESLENIFEELVAEGHDPDTVGPFLVEVFQNTAQAISSMPEQSNIDQEMIA